MGGWISKASLVVALAVVMPGVEPARADVELGRTADMASTQTARQVWVSDYDGTGHRWDWASAIAISPDGTRVFSTGRSWGARQTRCACGPSRDDYATVAYRARTGMQLWARRYNGPGNELDDPADIVVGPGGRRVYVTGGSVGASGAADFATVAYETATGRQVWARRYNGPDGLADEARSIGVSSDGSVVFVTGWSGMGFVTLAYRTATGATLWTTRSDTSAGQTDLAEDLAVSPDGSAVFVTGSTRNPSVAGDAITVAYDATTGSELWTARYAAVGDTRESSGSIDVSPDGTTVFIAGDTAPSAGDSDYATVAYDAVTGTQLWSATYDGPGNGADVADAVGVSPDGTTVFATGSSQGSMGVDYATVAYDAITGTERWAARYNGPDDGNDFAREAAFSPDGSVIFVTGYSHGAARADFATVAYDAATGAERWVERYDDPSHRRDRAVSLAVSPDGARVFVLGYVRGEYADYATVAYSV